MFTLGAIVGRGHRTNETPNWFKIIWWLLLLGLLGLLLWQRFGEEVFVGNGTAVDLFFFGLLAILPLLPLFREFEMFGIKLKTEIEDLKSDMNQRFNQIRQNIQTVALSNCVSQQIHFPEFRPQDVAFPEMERALTKFFKLCAVPTHLLSRLMPIWSYRYFTLFVSRTFNPRE